MRGNKIGNYKFYRTIGEGAFAKVKGNAKKYYLYYEI
mgnify:CR=1 FL=1